MERLTDRVSWDAGAFAATFDELSDYLKRDEDNFLCTATLDNFQMDKPHLDIRENLWIEELSWAERQKKYEELTRSPMRMAWNESEIFKVEYVLRSLGPVSRNNNLWAAVHQRQRLIGSALSSLRLMAPGLVSSRMTWWTGVEPRFHSIGPGLQGSMSMPVGGPDMQLSASAAVATSVDAIIRALDAPPWDSGFEVAMRRYEYGYERSNEEDRMVDYWIGLEALFTTADEKAETADKLARRIARLLGETPEARLNMFRKVKTLYRTRSRLVHGSPPSRDRVLADTEESANLLREALRSRLLTRWAVQQLEEMMMQ